LSAEGLRVSIWLSLWILPRQRVLQAIESFLRMRKRFPPRLSVGRLPVIFRVSNFSALRSPLPFDSLSERPLLRQLTLSCVYGIRTSDWCSTMHWAEVVTRSNTSSQSSTPSVLPSVKPKLVFHSQRELEQVLENPPRPPNRYRSYSLSLQVAPYTHGYFFLPPTHLRGMRWPISSVARV